MLWVWSVKLFKLKYFAIVGEMVLYHTDNMKKAQRLCLIHRHSVEKRFDTIISPCIVLIRPLSEDAVAFYKSQFCPCVA